VTGMRAPDEARRPFSPDRHRTFIAVPLSPDIRDAAVRARRPLAAYADRFRWVSPPHLHLTLQFLGDITSAQVADATEAAAAAARATTAFPIVLAGVDAFPSLAAPRVVWAGITAGAERLTALADALGRALQERRFVLDPRPFRPHLTLGRLRGTERPPNLRGETAALDRVMLGKQTVGNLIVVTSVLGPSEPEHTIVAAVRLGEMVRSDNAREMERF
jgi:2'-5' RNA ligase